jgi:hypothetical protein
VRRANLVVVAQVAAIAFFTLLSFSTLAVAQNNLPQMLPLQAYIAQSGIEKDPAALGYIASRCSALYAVFAKGMEGETDPERQRAQAEWVQIAEKFMGIATKTMMTGSTIEFQNALVKEKDTIVKLGNMYTERIDDARLRTNNMFSDSLIAGDFSVCKTLAKAK